MHCKYAEGSLPAPILSMATVLGRSAAGGRGSLGGYRVVLKRVLIKVDFPKPDSPVCVENPKSELNTSKPAG